MSGTLLFFFVRTRLNVDMTMRCYILCGPIARGDCCDRRALAPFASVVVCRNVAVANANSSNFVFRRFFQDNDRFLGANPKTSTRFDRHFSIMDYLRINVGAERGLPLVSAATLVL